MRHLVFLVFLFVLCFNKSLSDEKKLKLDPQQSVTVEQLQEIIAAKIDLARLDSKALDNEVNNFLINMNEKKKKKQELWT